MLNLNQPGVKFTNRSSGIYRIKAPNGDMYIGRSRGIKERLWNHRRAGLLGSRINSLLKESFERHGVDSHLFEAVEIGVIGDSRLDQREKLWIDALFEAEKAGLLRSLNIQRRR